MFVSGNPTLPSKTLPTLNFYWILKKMFWKWRKVRKKTYFHEFFKKKNKIKITYRPTLPILFQTITRNRHIFLGLIKSIAERSYKKYCRKILQDLSAILLICIKVSPVYKSANSSSFVLPLYTDMTAIFLKMVV